MHSLICDFDKILRTKSVKINMILAQQTIEKIQNGIEIYSEDHDGYYKDFYEGKITGEVDIA